MKGNAALVLGLIYVAALTRQLWFASTLCDMWLTIGFVKMKKWNKNGSAK